MEHVVASYATTMVVIDLVVGTRRARRGPETQKNIKTFLTKTAIPRSTVKVYEVDGIEKVKPRLKRPLRLHAPRVLHTGTDEELVEGDMMIPELITAYSITMLSPVSINTAASSSSSSSPSSPPRPSLHL